LLLAATSCTPSPGEPTAWAGPDPELLHGAVEKLTDVMVESVTSPPVSSRTYAYASIAAYEALVPGHPEFSSLAGQVNGLEPIPQPDPEQEYLLELSSVHAFLSVAAAIVFEPQLVVARRDSIADHARRSDVPRHIIDRSIEYGEQVASHVLAWAAKDNLKRARALTRYEVFQEEGRWQPTPPAYIAAIEPNWMVLRPFTMDSASQFRPAPPIPYDMREGSPFFAEVREVYEVGYTLTDEQREIAAFWDCNPYALKTEGHFMFAVKKISPGGHWMGITAIAARKVDADLVHTAEAYAKVAMALADGFISTWDEKYRSNLVRPETVINEKINPAWRPVLQTPPFPEYPSGHSVISTAAAEVLTAVFGDGFAYDDDVEVKYGLPVRSFGSFRQAAAEAAISRLYGGIHYRMGIEHGVKQGRALGENAVARIQTRSSGLATTSHP
jgi:hypothetical protein